MQARAATRALMAAAALTVVGLPTLMWISARPLQAATRMDAAALYEAPVEAKKVPIARPVAPKADTSVTGSRGAALVDQAGDGPDAADEIDADTLRGISLLIDSTPPGPKQDLLSFNRAVGIERYTRKKLLAQKGLTLDTKSAQLIQVAIRDLNRLVGHAQSSAENAQKARTALGYAYIFIDQVNAARDQFSWLLKEAERTGKFPKRAGWMALFIAESWFTDGNFARAQDYYHRYAGKMTEPERELAGYKEGWCWINLNQPARAEKLFAVVAKSESKQGLARDGRRDLAYLLSHHSNVKDAQVVADTMFGQSAARLEFLELVRLGLESQNSPALHRELVTAMLATPGLGQKERLRLSLADLRVQRTPLVSRNYLTAFQALEAEARKSGATPTAEERSYLLLVEKEAQAIIKTFVDAFTGRRQLLEAWDRKALGAALLDLLTFHEVQFAASPNAPLILHLHLEACQDLKDWACIDRVADRIAQNPKWVADREAARLDQLFALEKLSGEPGLVAAAQSERAKNYRAHLRTFLQTFGKSTEWVRVGKAYAALLLSPAAPAEERKAWHSLALPVLTVIAAREGGRDSLFRLQTLRFELKRYEELQAETRDAKFPADAELAGIRREASLAQAAVAKEHGNFSDYEAQLKKFIASHPTPQKARLAWADLLGSLGKDAKVAQVTEELRPMAPADRFSPELSPFTLAAWDREFKTGNASAAQDLIRGAPVADPEMQVRISLSAWGAADRPLAEALGAVVGPKRDYLLGLIALSAPVELLKLLEREAGSSGGLSADHRALAQVALKLTQASLRIQRNAQSERLLGPKFVFEEDAQKARIPIEAKLATLQPPSAKLSAKKQSAALPGFLGAVQATRAQVAQALGGAAPAAQLRVLEAGIRLENSAAAAVVGSEIPKGLTAEEIDKYRKGLEEAAAEFTNQAQEYGKSVTQLHAILGKVDDERVARIPAALPAQSWLWPVGYETEPRFGGLRAYLSQRRWAAALAWVDLVKSELGEDGYYRARAGVLLTADPEVAMRQYVVDELDEKKQSKLHQEWVQATAPKGAAQ